MVAFSDLTQVMQNARTDAKTLDEYVHGAADTQVTSRLGKRYWTLATLDNKLSLVKIKAEKTLADIDTLAKSATDSITAKSNSANTTIDNKAAQANSDIAAKVASANTAIDTQVASIDTRANAEINNLQSAINTAAAAAAGANGWNDMLIAVSENVNQRQINDGLDNVAQLSSINNPRNGQRVYIKSVAAHYIYNSNLTATPNGVTIVGKWEMELQDYYYASWFCNGSTPTTPKHTEFNVGYAYATSKGKPFIVDTNIYVDGTPRTEGITRAVKVLNNSQLLFTPKGKLTQIPVNEAAYSILNCFGADNFYIFSPVLEGDKLTALGTTGEWGYGLSVTGCTNGLIEYPQMINCRGDGLYIGQEYFTQSATSLCPKDIKIIKPKIINAGRNGISLCCGENIYIDTPYVDVVEGKAPQACIDIEPEQADNSPLKSYLKNVIVHNATLLRGKSSGVLQWINGSRDVNVKFTGTTTISGCYAVLGCNGSADDWDNVTCNGSITFENIVFDHRITNDTAGYFDVSVPTRGKGIGVIIDTLEIHTQTPDAGYQVAFMFNGRYTHSGNFKINQMSVTDYGSPSIINMVRTFDGSTNLEHIKIPIPGSRMINHYDGVGTYTCGDYVDIGGYENKTVHDINAVNILTNTTIFTPAFDATDGMTFTRVLTTPNKGRKLTYVLANVANVGYGLIANTSINRIESTEKLASITVDNTGSIDRVSNTVRNWTFYS